MANVVVHHQYIFRLEIPVDDILAVEVVNSKCNLTNDDQSISVRENPTIFRDKGHEVATGSEVEEEK